MSKIHILGTLAGFESEKRYTTCFILENNNKLLLVDTGSSDRVVFNIEKSGFKIEDIHNIFISHKHSDHLLGMIGLIRRYVILYRKNKLKEKLNIYCSQEVKDSLCTIYECLFREEMIDIINQFTNYVIIKDRDILDIEGNEYKIFDCLAKGFSLMGFETIINNKKVFFMGDEELKPELCERVRNADYVLYEVFCLEKDKESQGRPAFIHGSVKDAAILMNELNVKNIILYHTVEENEIDRKTEYTKEAKEYFEGKVFVPEDLDIIDIK